MNIVEFARRYDDLMFGGGAEFLYGDSGYFNVGYWSPETADQRQACEELVGRVVRRVPRSIERVLDAGCGCGAGTQLLKRCFPGSAVVGINISESQLRQSTARSPESAFVLMDAARLALPRESFDCVVSIEAAFHFRTRAQFFREAIRVMRPGGWLALSDILFRNANFIGGWMVPHENRIECIADYERTLADAGFASIQVVDAYRECWGAFCKRGAAAARREFEQGAIDATSFKFRWDHFASLAERVAEHYLLVTARKAGS